MIDYKKFADAIEGCLSPQRVRPQFDRIQHMIDDGRIMGTQVFYRGIPVDDMTIDELRLFVLFLANGYGKHD